MSGVTLTDDQIADVLMVGYGYHRKWDYLNWRPQWVKGRLSGTPTNPLNDEPPETWQEYEEIEELVANGELCSKDGEPCDWERMEEIYGEDRDGNRGVMTYYKRCRKCGDER